MVTKITYEKAGISLARFKIEAKQWYPRESKKYYKNGKHIATYLGNTKRVSMVKKN